MVKIARAQLDFEKGEFGRVLERIADLKPDLFYLKIDIRNLTLMAYYELGYVESVISGLDSYRHFIADNKTIPEAFKKIHLRFINAFGSMIKSKERNEQEKLEELRDSLKQYTTEKRIRWLIEKIGL